MDELFVGQGILGMIMCGILATMLMLVFTAGNNTRKTKKETPSCDHDWEFDGENGSNTGAFYRCKKCGKLKYIPYKEMMAMPEKDYNFWSTRPTTTEEKYRQQTTNKTAQQ